MQRWKEKEKEKDKRGETASRLSDIETPMSVIDSSREGLRSP